MLRLLPPYHRSLAGDLAVASARPDHAERLEALQRLVFPTLADALRFKAPHYRRHLEIFPDGQFVALAGDVVVGATTTLRLDFDFRGAAAHTFADVVQGGWLTAHDPEGDWLYGADVSVHPRFRRRGLAMAFYAARQELVWALGLKGQVTAGMMSGYGAARQAMTPEEYYAGLRAGRIDDPTISVQLRAGFEPRALLRDYLDDPVCANCAVLLVLDATRDVPGAVRPRAAPAR